MANYYTIENAKITGTILQIQIDGKEHTFDLIKHSNLLKFAAQEQRQNFNISPSGYGIHWPDIDEYLSINGLLGIIQKPPRMEAVV